ncbi:MAG: TrkA family potassium uptake protein [Candidatus Limnocylindrales bacterium]
MKIVIIGSGRVGAVLAEAYDSAGHDVIILDVSARAFDRLPAEFHGTAIRGDGTDEDSLLRAGVADADAFLALTEGDNRNVMACQVATEKFGITNVIAKINDPVRAAAYADLGLAVLCRTTMQAEAVTTYLGLGSLGTPGVTAPTGTHHGGDRHDPLAESVDAGAAGQGA